MSNDKKDPWRPTKYEEDTPQKVIDYLGAYEEVGDVIPSIAGLALYLGISRETIYDWSAQKGKAAFSDTLKKLQAEQEAKLLANGLLGKYNPTITKLILYNHKYADSAKVDHTTKGKEISSSADEEIIRRAIEKHSKENKDA